MKKFKYVLFTMMAIAISTVATMAQAGSGGYNETYVCGNKALGARIGFCLAAGLAGNGQGLDGSKAAEGAARNPGAAGTVQTMMIIALALIESLVLFALLIVFVVLR